MGCTVSFHCRPHIRKYLLFHLAPGERLCEPGNQDLLERLSRLFKVRVLHVILDAELSPQPKSFLKLASVGPGVDPVWRNLGAFNHHVEELYEQHSHRWLDWYCSSLNTQLSAAMTAWRSQYGITEEDHLLDSELRRYHRYRVRQGRALPRGGSRPGRRVYR